jgi:hypothetical protein
VQSVADRELHQAVVRGMKLDAIDADTRRIVRLEDRWKLIRRARPLDRLLAADHSAKCRQPRSSPRRAFTLDRFNERLVSLEHVVVD